MVSKAQNSKWLSSGCFQSVLCRFHVLFYVWFLIFVQPIKMCYNIYFPVLIVVFRTKNRNNCNASFVLRVFLIFYLKLVFLWFFVCMFCVCIFSLFNIINIVSYIEIISVFNDFSNYSQYVPTKHNKILSPVTNKKNHKHFFIIKNPSSAIWCGVI
jgi:hypothetical protein